jgi:hypothetical protein
VWSGYRKFGGEVDIIKLAVEEEIIGEIIRGLGFIAPHLQIRDLQNLPAGRWSSPPALTH